MSELEISLVRGDGKEVSSYNDAVDLYYAFGGQNGVLKDVYLQFEAAAIDINTLRISSGAAVLYGRQCKIAPGTYKDINLDTLSGSSVRFYSVYIKVATNLMNHKASIVIDYTTYAYPSPSVNENLLINMSGEAYITLYQFKHSVSGISDLIFKADILEPYGILLDEEDKTYVKFAREADNAHRANYADSANISAAATLASLAANREFNDNSSYIANTAYVDKMFKILWSNSSGSYEVNTANISNYNKYTYIMVWCKGDGGHAWVMMPRLSQNPSLDNTFNNRVVRQLTTAPIAVFNGVLVPMSIGYLISGGGTITSILTSNRSDFRIYQIIGVK